MKLYEYDEVIETMYRAGESEDGVDAETGMVFDITQLDAWEAERDAKLENVLLYAEQLKADAEEIGDYIKRLTERKRAKDNAAKSIREWITARLRETESKKFETKRIRATVSVTAGGKAEITDMDAIPEEYRSYSWKPDLTNIKAALKNGWEIPGAKLSDSVRLTIK